MLALLDEALAMDPDYLPDIRIFVGDGHYACEPVVMGLSARGLILVSKLRRDAALWVPWTEPPSGRSGRASTPAASTASVSARCPGSSCRTKAGGCTMCSCTTSPSSACCGWSSSWGPMPSRSRPGRS